VGRSGGPRGDPGEGGGRGEEGRKGGGRSRGKEEGEAALPSEPGAARRRQPGRGCPPRRPALPAAGRADGQTDGQRCVQKAPGHVQPELSEKTLQPLGECPRPERGRSRGPSRRPPAPSPPPPSGRAPVAPGKPAPRAGGCGSGAPGRSRVLSPVPRPGDSATRNRGPECHSPGHPGKHPFLASSLMANRNPSIRATSV
jgi:hypothetical protein